MYQKKHLILTCIATTLIVWGFACLFFMEICHPVYLDPISKAKNLILDEYVNELTEEQLTNLNDAAISAMVYSLKDPYSAYLNTEAFGTYTETQKEEYQGIGVMVSYTANQNAMTVVSVYQNSPAEKAGLLPGDILTQVGEITLSPETYGSALDYIKEGTEDDIAIQILRDGKTMHFTVHREEVREQTVSAKMLDGKLGLIRIGEFNHSTSGDFAQALSSLKAEGMVALMIDLRDNPGGYADSVIEIADSLIPKGVIAYLEDNQGRRQYINSDAECLTMPMVVLIDGGSASASELLAGSLKAHGLATVIGEKSYGKAVGQSVYPLSDTTAMYLTNARYFTPNGECIDGIGITPDIQVALSAEQKDKMLLLSPQEDPQISEGIRVLSEQLAK